jgi:CrcB protein
VFLGGGAGSGARYLVSLAAMSLSGVALWGTLAVNVVGSCLLGLVYALSIRGVLPESARLGLGAGLIGGFTTYSTFNLEVLTLAQRGPGSYAVFYVLGTLVACLAAGLAGLWLGRALA